MSALVQVGVAAQRVSLINQVCGSTRHTHDQCSRLYKINATANEANERK